MSLVHNRCIFSNALVCGHYPGSARCFFLLKGSFSFPMSPSACSKRVVWLLGFSLYYCRVFTFQYKAPWGNCCCHLVLEKLKFNWITLLAYLSSAQPLQFSPCAMLFSSKVDSWAERILRSACVCVSVCVCASHCLWGHEIAPKPQGTSDTALPRHRASLSVTLSLISSFIFTLCGSMILGIMGICDYFLLVYHHSVPRVTFIQTS